ncbi:MAG: OmpL47-type beta-barrel domain-containing protein [Thermoplasmata archaeon]
MLGKNVGLVLALIICAATSMNTSWYSHDVMTGTIEMIEVHNVMDSTPRDSMVIQPNPGDMKDTYISSNSALQTMNFGISNILKVNGTQPEKVLLQFPISMPSGSVITAATLKLYCTYAENPSEALSVGCYKMLKSWEEGYGNGTSSPGATWYARDANNNWQSPGMAAGTDYESTPVSTTNVASASIWYSWNITSVFSEWVYGISQNYGVALMTNWGSGKYFNSSDSGVHQYWPKIEVSYYIDTTPPVTTATVIGTQGANGWYVSNVVVNLSASDSGIGVDKIYYRINSGQWQEYTSNLSFASEGVYNISYYAKDKVGNTETTKSVTVKIDLSPGNTEAYLTGSVGANNWYVSPVTLTLQATDSSSGINKTYYKLNTSFVWLQYTAPITFTNDSEYTVEFCSLDNAGFNETPKSINFRIDKTAPNTTSTVTGTSGENGWYVSEVSVKLSALDNSSGVTETYYRLNATDNWILYTQEFLISSEGIYMLEYYSIDSAGNNEGVKQREIRIDLTPPEVQLSITGSFVYSGWYNSTVNVSITTTDLSGISQILYSVDDGTWQNYTVPIKLSDGVHAFSYQVKNGAGLITTNTTEIKVDTQAPVSEAHLTGTLGAYGWYTSDVIVNLSATDNISGVDEIAYRYGEGYEWENYTHELYISTEGTTVIEFFARDVAGNLETVKSITIKIDSTPPRTNYNISGKEGERNWYTGRVSLKLLPEDATSGVTETFYRIGATGDWIRYVSDLTFDDGTYEVFFYSVDTARNKEVVKNVSFKVDTIPPDVKHTPITEALYSEEIQISVTISEFGSGIADARLYYKNPAWGSYRDVKMSTSDGKTYTATISKDDATLDGLQYYIEVKDNAGNTVRLPSGGNNAPYFINVHINYWYLLLLIPLILLIVFIVFKKLDYWDDFVDMFKPKKKEVAKEEKPKAPPTVKCASCGYPIPHETVNQSFVCPSCGAVFHPACASRLTSCPNCNNPIH